LQQRYNQVGLYRLLRLEWLERTARLFLAGNEASVVRRSLQEELKDVFSSSNTETRGSLNKTITVLVRVWGLPPRDLYPLQRDGLRLLSSLPPKEHMVIHWGMVMAVYPFWGSVAAQVGRLLRLQGAVVTSQVQRRLREQYGERETVFRRVHYVLRSFVDWGVLNETGKQRIYTAGIAHEVALEEVIAWLAEAVLRSQPNGALPLNSILNSTSLFPFCLRPISGLRLASFSGRLEVLRHGLEEDLLVLRNEGVSEDRDR